MNILKLGTLFKAVFAQGHLLRQILLYGFVAMLFSGGMLSTGMALIGVDTVEAMYVASDDCCAVTTLSGPHGFYECGNCPEDFGEHVMGTSELLYLGGALLLGNED